MISPPTLEASLRSLLDSVQGIPGVLARVEVGGDAVVAAGGVADRLTREPMTPEHAFRIASNTKTFVAVAMLRLCERQLVALDQPIERLLPLAVHDVLGRRYDLGSITVQDLLQHTSGIAGHDRDDERASPTPPYVGAIGADPQHRWTAVEQIRFSVDRFPPTNAPGAEVRYSDTGYIVAGQVLEHLTGLRLSTVLRTECCFEELGLSSTWTESLEARPSKVRAIAHVYHHDEDWTGVDPSIDLYGGGGLVSTAGDLARFWRSLFAGELVRDASLRTMITTRPNRASEGDAGLGIFRSRIGHRTWWTHHGFWGSLAVHDPDRDLTAVVFRNQSASETEDLSPTLDVL